MVYRSTLDCQQADAEADTHLTERRRNCRLLSWERNALVNEVREAFLEQNQELSALVAGQF